MVTPAEVAGAVTDPELPFLTIAELGILREVEVDDGTVTVTITPTYTGCPAVDAIRDDLRGALTAAGFARAEVRTRLSPPWRTDWITEAGRAKLAEAGVAPPTVGGGPVPVRLSVRCPRCGAPDTEELSRFGATACTALWRCRACAEPFSRVKER